ncbi:MAG: hypothetical protein ACKV2V_19000 [Blastocatellia bacterium]
MSKQLQKKLDMFQRVQDFGLIHQAEFPEGSAGRQLFSDIGEIITRIQDADLSKTNGRGVNVGHTMRRQELRAGVMAQLQAIARTARAMPLTREQAVQFRAPQRVGEKKLVILGRATAEAARPHEAEFVRYSLPAGFLMELLATVTTLENLREDAGENVRGQSNDSLAQREAAAAGMSTVSRLHAVVRNHFAGRALVLDMWEHARVIRHTTRADNSAETETAKGQAAGSSGRN